MSATARTSYTQGSYRAETDNRQSVQVDLDTGDHRSREDGNVDVKSGEGHAGHGSNVDGGALSVESSVVGTVLVDRSVCVEGVGDIKSGWRRGLFYILFFAMRSGTP